MKIATIDYSPLTLLQACKALGEDREVKPANFQNALANIFAAQSMGANHTIKGYRSGGIKDGWHHLNALAALMAEGTLPADFTVPVEIHD